jgi:hypothetical protein
VHGRSPRNRCVVDVVLFSSPLLNPTTPQAEEKQYKAADKAKQLGVSLRAVVEHHGTDIGVLRIPSLLVAADAVVRGDLDAEGLFRVGGSASSHQKILKQIGGKGDPEFVPTTQDWTGLVKSFIRDLPEPVLTYRFYPAFIAAARLTEHEERTRAVLLLCLDLPTESLHVLVYLCSLLAAVTANEVNRMSAQSLASIFAPNILRPRMPGDGKRKMTPAETQELATLELRDHGACSQAVAVMILHHAELGAVPEDIQFMAGEFTDEEAAVLYKQLLALPPGQWWQPNTESAGLGRSASERPSKKKTSKADFQAQGKQQNRHTAIDFGSLEIAE